MHFRVKWVYWSGLYTKRFLLIFLVKFSRKFRRGLKKRSSVSYNCYTSQREYVKIDEILNFDEDMNNATCSGLMAIYEIVSQLWCLVMFSSTTILFFIKEFLNAYKKIYESMYQGPKSTFPTQICDEKLLYLEGVIRLLPR